jgi:hypothetical protein
MPSFIPDKVAIRVEPLLRIHGYSKPDQVRRDVREHAERAVARANEVIEPAVVYEQLPIAHCDEHKLVLSTGTAFEHSVFSKYLSTNNEVIVFALTVGAGFDLLVTDLLGQEEILDALFLETAGWLGLEGVTKSFAQYLRESAKGQNLRITRRLGPGYFYPVNGKKVIWRLEDQHSLFDLLNDTPLPIGLLESGAMQPKLSRSGLYGLVPK